MVHGDVASKKRTSWAIFPLNGINTGQKHDRVGILDI